MESWRGDRRRTGPYQRGLSNAPVYTTRPGAALRLFMDMCFVSDFGEVRIKETGRKLGKNKLSRSKVSGDKKLRNATEYTLL